MNVCYCPSMPRCDTCSVKDIMGITHSDAAYYTRNSRDECGKEKNGPMCRVVYGYLVGR